MNTKNIQPQEKNILEKIFHWGFLTTLFLTPLLVFSTRFSPFITSKTYFFIGAVSWLCLLWIVLMLGDAKYRITKKQLLWLSPLVALVGWMTISAIVGIDPSLSLLGSFARGTGLVFFYYLLVFVAMGISLISVHADHLVKKIYQIIIASSVVIAISSFFVGGKTFDIASLVLNGSAMGGLSGNSSYSGAFMVFGLFLGILLLIQSWKTKEKWVYIISLLIIIVSPIVTNFDLFKGNLSMNLLLDKPYLIIGEARMAVLAMIIGIGISLGMWLVTAQKNKLKIVGLIMILGIIGVIGFGTYGLLTENHPIRNSFIETAGDNRFIFWDSALQGMNERPVFGWGNENYAFVYQKFLTPAMFQESRGFEVWVDRPHNIFLEFGVHSGYVGMVLYGIFLISIFIFWTIIYRKKIISREVYAMMIGLLSAYILQNQLVFDWIGTYLGIAILFAIPIGIIDRLDEKNTPRQQLSGNMRKSIIITTAIILTIGWWYFAIKPVVLAKNLEQAIRASIEERIKMYDDIFGNRYIQGSAGFFANKIHTAYFQDPEFFKDSPARRDVSSREILALLDALETNEHRFRNDYRVFLAGIKLVNMEIFISGNITQEKIDRSFRFFEKIKELSPQNLEGYIEFSETLVFAGLYQEAVETALQAVEMNPYYITGHINLINILKAVATDDSIKKGIANAKKYFPDEEF